MRLQQARRDYYRRLARREGYPSRAAFKLMQLDDKYKIIKKGATILDIGCSPGGWSKVACERVGNAGLVVGIDITPPTFKHDRFVFIKSDIADVLPERITEYSKQYDVALSDISPNITGIWELDNGRQIELSKIAFRLACKVLKKGGSCIFKAFQGEFTDELISVLKPCFQRVIISKPEASRKQSSEIYLVCLNFVNPPPEWT
ncbi:MAG: RlmE family RNA methyltransferase [Nitrososphaerota archaeon]